MGIRPKLFLIFFTCGILPMLVFGVVNYLSGSRSVSDLLRHETERETRAVAANLELALRAREVGLSLLSRSRSLREYVRAGGTHAGPAATQTATRPESNASAGNGPTSGPTSDGPPPEVRAEVDALLSDNRNEYESLACLSTDGQPLFRAEPTHSQTAGETARYQMTDILPGRVSADAHVWEATNETPLRSTVSHESSGTTVRYTIPVFVSEVGPQSPRGALVVDLKLSELCKEAIIGLEGSATTPRLFVAIGPSGQIVYYTNEALLHRPAASALPPSFKPVTDSMLAGRTGQQFFDSPEGERWLISYQPVKAAGLFLGVAGNETVALHSIRRIGWLSILLSALAGGLTAVLLTLVARRMERSIERVTEGAVAIAGGRLDQRIEVRSSDETRLLAESFNRMTDRLREQIAREAETRQFESFMRLAAMLTHDLKNSITALSLVVSNMEQQFDREEFRAEAMESLKESTDKLRSLVAKLSGPVESLSGEYQRPRPVDLVALMRHVLGRTAEQSSSLHRIETRLPTELIAVVDAERIERVFENLVLNALEAMGTTSGTLTVEAGHESDDEIFFSVSDTGPGISEEFQRTRLFRAFATTKRKGVGLGLYTCREVVRAHGGRIDVKSAKGAGATFRVVIPSARFTEGDMRSSVVSD